MRVVILTGADGKTKVAVNADQWHTIMVADKSDRGAKTRIGFSGPASPLLVAEEWQDVVDKLGSGSPSS